MVDGINGNSKVNINLTAEQMDAMDGKKDGFISASIWNSYAGLRGGNKIKNKISLNNAQKSINYYDKSAFDKNMSEVTVTAKAPNMIKPAAMPDLAKASPASLPPISGMLDAQAINSSYIAQTGTNELPEVTVTAKAPNMIKPAAMPDLAKAAPESLPPISNMFDDNTELAEATNKSLVDFNELNPDEKTNVLKNIGKKAEAFSNNETTDYLDTSGYTNEEIYALPNGTAIKIHRPTNDGKKHVIKGMLVDGRLVKSQPNTFAGNEGINYYVYDISQITSGKQSKQALLGAYTAFNDGTNSIGLIDESGKFDYKYNG